jgi:hypothetical protein
MTVTLSPPPKGATFDTSPCPTLFETSLCSATSRNHCFRGVFEFAFDSVSENRIKPVTKPAYQI